jgi:hypothetical protein
MLIASALRAADAPTPQPVKTVLEHYLKIRASLAADTMKGVGENARAIAATVRTDDTKSLPPAVAEQANALAQSRELIPARDAFKSLSTSLIEYLNAHPASKGAFHVVYCPMAQASWLQTSTVVSNPYMGREMNSCGVVKN